MGYCKTLSLLVLFFLSSCSTTEFEYFRAKTLSGAVITPEDLQGKVIVINLWATWCGPCIKEIPQLNALRQKYSENNQVLFLAISDDKPEVIKRFLQRRPFEYIQISDPSLTNQLQSGFANSIPKHIVVNPKGQITFYQEGVPNDLLSLLEHQIQENLEE